MQLKLQRSQRMGGVTGNTVLFCLDVRAEYSAQEAANIGKYKLSGEVIYNSQAAKKHLDNMGEQLDRTQSGSVRERATGLARGMYSYAMAKIHLNISIDSLGRGHHIECKDLPELMEAEEAVMKACRNLRDYLSLASSFNGSIVLVDFDNGEEQHVSQGMLQIAGPSGGGVAAAAMTPSAVSADFDSGEYVLTYWKRFTPAAAIFGITLLATYLFNSSTVFWLGTLVALSTGAYIAILPQ